MCILINRPAQVHAMYHILQIKLQCVLIMLVGAAPLPKVCRIVCLLSAGARAHTHRYTLSHTSTHTRAERVCRSYSAHTSMYARTQYSQMHARTHARTNPKMQHTLTRMHAPCILVVKTILLSTRTINLLWQEALHMDSCKSMPMCM